MRPTPQFVTLSAVSVDSGEVTASGGRWIHLLPAGRFMARDGRGPFDAGGKADLTRIVATTRKFLGQTEMAIDYDHQTVFAAVSGVGGTAKAAGWVKKFEVRHDGVWGLVEWTAAAAAAIRAGEYRYLSPVIITREGSPRVISIRTPGLVNSPALDLHQVAASASLQTEGATMIKIDPARRTRVLKLLGLPADATDEQIAVNLGELRDLLDDGSSVPTSATPDPSQFVPMSVFQEAVAEANRLRQGITEDAARALVDEHVRSGKLAPFMKEWAVELCTVNQPAFEAFISNTGAAFSAMVTPQFSTRKRNPSDQKELSDDEMAVCRHMGISPDQFNRARLPA